MNGQAIHPLGIFMPLINTLIYSPSNSYMFAPQCGQ